MMKFMKNKLFALMLSVVVMALGVVVPSFTNTAQAAAATTKTVYVDVEKNVIGQAPIVQPEKVTLDSSKTIIDATKQATKQYTGDENNVDVESTTYGNYVTAFADTSDTQTAFANNYPGNFKTKLISATKNVVFRTDLPNQPIITDANWLRETEYDGISGWMFTVNNTDNNAGTYYTGDTTLANVPDGATIRWEFSAAVGCDLGMSGYLPDGTVSGGYYNWSSTPTAPFFTRADKSTLISKMANHADKTDTAYTNALTVLQKLQATDTEVNTAAAAL